MTLDSLASTNILKDLEDLYFMALEKGNYSVALKAKELLGRERGLFALKNTALQKPQISLENISDENLNHLIEELEVKLTLDHSGGAEYTR
jgi:uncharacterized protein YfkK (UPF0435 family)